MTVMVYLKELVDELENNRPTRVAYTDVGLIFRDENFISLMDSKDNMIALFPVHNVLAVEKID